MKAIINIGSVSIVLAVAALWWGFRDASIQKSFAPSRTNLTFEEFILVPSRLSKLRTFELGGTNYIEALGSPPTGVLLYGASGPPAYVFGPDGTLVDWTGDRGETPQYTRKWGTFGGGRAISVDDAKSLLAPGRKTSPSVKQ